MKGHDMAGIVEQARRRCRGNLIIVSLVNWHYAAIGLNWARALEQLGIDQYLLVSLDAPVHRFLRRRRVATVSYRTGARRWKELLREKMAVPLALIEADMDVLLCDSDAVWLADPLPGFVNVSTADIIGSIVTHKRAHPREARREWGFTICTGWILFRSRTGPVAHLRDLLATGYYDQAGREDLPKGDQGAFNVHLLRREPKVRATEEGGYLLEVPQSRGGDGSLLPPMGVEVLSDRVVHRGDRREGDWVCHPLAPKTAGETEAKLREQGLWWLGDGVPSLWEKTAAFLPLPVGEEGGPRSR